MKRVIVMLLISLILCLSLVFAELRASEPNDIYNLGDKLFITITDIKGSETGNLNVDLICSNSTVNLLKLSARAFSSEGGQSYSIPYKFLTKGDLEIDDLSAIVGDCRIKTNLANEIIESKSFVISRDLNVNANLNKVVLSPGDSVHLNIDVSRADGDSFEGFFRIMNFSAIEGEVVGGIVDKDIVIESSMPAGNYFMSIEVYDLDLENNVMNSGSENLFVEIKQVPTSIEMGISDLEIVPGNNFKINPSILDQSGIVMNGTVSIYVTDPDEKKYDYSAVSGTTIDIPFMMNATQGTWTVYAFSNGLSQENQVDVLGVERINYSFENSILRIENVGNIDYYGVVDVGIGEMTHNLELTLKKGTFKEYVLEAPEGEYEITVNDGENIYTGSGFLTGNAIGIRELGGGGGIKGFSFIWVFLVLLVGCMGFIMIGMFKKTKVVSKTSFKDKVKGTGKKLINFKGKKKVVDTSKEDKNIIDLTKKEEMGDAESTLVIDGDKVKTTIVAIKIKDKDAFTDDIQHDVVKIIKENCGAKGVVDVKEDFIYLIYSPLITKSYKNDLYASKVALNIVKSLTEYKKKMSGDLKFGVSVNHGNLVSKKEGVKLKYTGLENTFLLSNKIAEKSENNVLVPDKIRNGLMRDLKVTKVDNIGDVKIFVIEEIKDREANKAKLDDLLKRMEK